MDYIPISSGSREGIKTNHITGKKRKHGHSLNSNISIDSADGVKQHNNPRIHIKYQSTNQSLITGNTVIEGGKEQGKFFRSNQKNI